MKKRLFAKLRSKAGETLVETLFAILIATFASILLAGSTTTAVELNRQARERDRVNQLCLEKLAKQNPDDVQVIKKKLRIAPMQMNADGKLEPKAEGDHEKDPVDIDVSYNGCKIDEAGTLGDFSTYSLIVTTSEEEP